MDTKTTVKIDEKYVSCVLPEKDYMHISFSLNRVKNGSIFFIGSKRQTTFSTDQRFNWFQKMMWKICFGVSVVDFDEEKNGE